VLRIDQQTRKATLAGQYGSRGGFRSEYMGDTQPQANGNVFVGWGSEPYFSEYDRNGKLLFEGELPGPNLSYRATLESWVGKPLTKPVGEARTSEGKTIVYASWNGATEVASWRVLDRSGAAKPAVLATHAKAGFETAMPISQAGGSLQLQALDANGRVIGVSRAFAAAGS
jgi:hypothetical protein